MTAPAVLPGRAPDEAALDDWGPVDEPVGRPVSRTSGTLLAGGSGSFPEAGYWRCTEGRWRCEIARSEFCHFLEGDCTYHGDDGSTIEATGGVTVWFPAGWTGECLVRTAVAKVYVIV